MSTDDRQSLLPRLLLFLAPFTVLLTGCGGPDLIDRMTSPRWGFCGTVLIVLDIVALIDLIGDDDRSAANKVIWTLLIVFFPLGGVILYFLFGRE